MIYLDEYKSPLGTLSLASDGESLCGLWLEGQKYYQDKLEQRLGTVAEDKRVAGERARRESPGIKAARIWLDAYFSGRDPGQLPPVTCRGTAFQETVWKCLEEIPYGTLATYGEIARKVEARRGTQTSARAVGVAVGRNPVSIIVPCHRVVGSTGSLTGYAGGIDRKIKLLQIEGIDTSALEIPTKGTAL